MNIIDKLKKAEENRKKYDTFSTQSFEWWRKKVQGIVGGARARTDLMEYSRREKHNRQNVTIGRLYSYWYDAKHKDTLPYWDQFPMVFIVDVGPNYFTGLNLHYLPPRLRAILFSKLLDLNNWKNLEKRTRLAVSYKILKAASNLNLFAPCFKKYLFSHVESKFMLIPATDWEVCLFLPTQSFVGAPTSKIWSDSLLSIK